MENIPLWEPSLLQVSCIRNGGGGGGERNFAKRILGLRVKEATLISTPWFPGPMNPANDGKSVSLCYYRIEVAPKWSFLMLGRDLT